MLSDIAATRDDAGRVLGTVSATDATAITAAQTTFGVVTAADGAFDEPAELLVVRGDGRGWSAGPHPIRLRSRDAAGSWSVWRDVSIVVARILRARRLRARPRGWTTRGAVRPTRAAALVGRYGLDVRPRGPAAYVEDPSPIADRTLDVSLRLRATGLAGTVRLLELTRRRAGGRWPRSSCAAGRSARAAAGGSCRAARCGITLRLARGRATLVVNGRRGPSVRADGAVDALRLGAVRGGRGSLAIDQFTALRGLIGAGTCPGGRPQTSAGAWTQAGTGGGGGTVDGTTFGSMCSNGGSIVMFGRILSSQRGMYQDFSPSSVSSAGTTVSRMISASREDRDRQQQAELLADAIGRQHEGDEHRGHDDRRGEHDAADGRRRRP